MRLRTLALLASTLLSGPGHAAVTFDSPERAVSSDDDRPAVYRQWSTALQQAWAVEARENQAESTFWLPAELYRQGHNLDVQRTADPADRIITQCLAACPDSICCCIFLN